MPVSNSGVEPAFVKRLAAEYFRRYRDEGAQNAAQWAGRMIKRGTALEKDVKHEVAQLIRTTLRGT